MALEGVELAGCGASSTGWSDASLEATEAFGQKTGSRAQIGPNHPEKTVIRALSDRAGGAPSLNQAVSRGPYPGWFMVNGLAEVDTPTSMTPNCWQAARDHPLQRQCSLRPRKA